MHGDRRRVVHGSAALRSRWSFAGTALPTSVQESEGMGRERRVRGFSFGDSGHRRGLDGGRPRAAIVAAMAARGELCSSRKREGHGLGHV